MCGDFLLTAGSIAFPRGIDRTEEQTPGHHVGHHVLMVVVVVGGFSRLKPELQQIPLFLFLQQLRNHLFHIFAGVDRPHDPLPVDQKWKFLSARENTDCTP